MPITAAPTVHVPPRGAPHPPASPSPGAAPTGTTSPTLGGLPPHVAGMQPDEVLRRLELTITRRLDGLLQGDYRGLVPGHGTESGETRLYLEGDDVRRIDWNVTARMQVPHLRETIAERELETWLLVDLSPSLDWGTANCTKRDLAVAAAAAAAFLTAKDGNRLGATLLTTEGQVTTLPARSGRNHLRAVLHRAITAPRGDGGGATDLAKGIRQLGMPSHRRGLAVIVSDFLTPSPWEQALRLATARHEVLAVEVLDPRELELPDVGTLVVTDPETGRQREVETTSARLRQRYAEAAREQRAGVARTLRSAGADHLVLRTDRDWLLDLVRFVALRRFRVDHLRRAGAASAAATGARA
jgi:uncharacterized protein (DUF58 family)